MILSGMIQGLHFQCHSGGVQLAAMRNISWDKTIRRSASTPSENKTMTIQRTIFASYALHFPSLAWPNLNIYVYWRHCRVTKVFHGFSTCQTTNSCTRASHGLRSKINGQNHVDCWALSSPMVRRHLNQHKFLLACWLNSRWSKYGHDKKYINPSAEKLFEV